LTKKAQPDKNTLLIFVSNTLLIFVYSFFCQTFFVLKSLTKIRFKTLTKNVLHFLSGQAFFVLHLKQKYYLKQKMQSIFCQVFFVSLSIFVSIFASIFVSIFASIFVSIFVWFSFRSKT